MANTISLSVDISTEDIGTLNDDTSFVSPVRTAVGVFVQIYKVAADSTQEAVTTTGNDEDPETDSSWEFAVATDGWYQAYYVSIPDYDIGTSYDQYDAVFDPTTDLVYRSVTNGNVGNAVTNPTYWEPITEPTSLAENEGEATESTNIDSAIYNRILIPKVNRYFGDVAVSNARECCGDCEREDNVNLFELVDFLREGALLAEQRLEFAEGERIIRRLDEFVTC